MPGFATICGSRQTGFPPFAPRPMDHGVCAAWGIDLMAPPWRIDLQIRGTISNFLRNTASDDVRLHKCLTTLDDLSMSQDLHSAEVMPL